MKRFSFLLVFVLILAFASTVAAGKNDKIYELDEVYKIGANGTLYLETDDADINITGTSRKDVHLVVKHRWDVSGMVVRQRLDFEMEVEEDGENLRIRDLAESNISMVFGSIHEFYEVILEVPETISMRIDGDDDKYKIKNVNGSITLDFDDGRARLIDCGGDDFEFETDDGTIEMDKARGTLVVIVEDGEFNLDSGELTELDSECEDGDLDIATTISDGGIYRMTTDDGSIRFRVQGGGGEFRVRKDDGRVITGRGFETEEKDDYFHMYKLPGGKAKVSAKIGDGKIRFSTEGK